MSEVPGRLPERVELSFPPGAASIRSAREVAAVAACEWGLDPARLDDVKLAVSELVANACHHAGRIVRLSMSVARAAESGERARAAESGGPARAAESGERARGAGDATVRVEVYDDSGGAPSIAGRDHLCSTGRGLAIVEEVTDRWGVRRDPARPGKWVWFELDAGARRGEPSQGGAVAQP